MEYKNNVFDSESIPEYALQPAKPEEEFDQAAYDHLYKALSAEKEALPMEPETAEDVVPVSGPAPFEMEQEPKQSGKEIGGKEIVEKESGEEKLQPVGNLIKTEDIKVADAENNEPDEADAISVSKGESEAEPDEADAISVSKREPEAEPDEADAISVSKGEPEAEPDEADAIPVSKGESEAEPDEADAIPVSKGEPEAGPDEIDVLPTSKKNLESESELHIIRKDKMPVAIPAAMPIYEKASVKKAAVGGQIEKTLDFTDLCRHKPIGLHVEEDVLIPDVKPDMKSLLYIEGRLQMPAHNVPFGSVSIKAEGDIIASTLYMPEGGEGIKGPISLETRIPFREDAAIDASSNSQIVIEAKIESIDVERINERKFRIKADILLTPREYRVREIKMFEGLENEEIECRHEGIKAMDVAFRKTETFELSEELRLKDDMPDIDMILLAGVNVVENHKQINREKAVIDATVFLNILYEDHDPAFYQGKLEFTQFIKIDEEKAFFTPLLGSRTTFCVNNLSIQPKKDDQGNCRIFDVAMNIDTDIEYYREIEDAAVVDLYHLEKEAVYETETVETRLLYGNSIKETSGRDIINIPEHFGGNPKVIYLFGEPELRGNYAEMGRCIIEGVIPVSLICQPVEAGDEPFCLKHKLDFRTSMDFPEATPDMEPDTELSLKELWFDSINSRQIEVNAGIAVSTNLFGKRSRQLVRSVGLIEPEKVKGKRPGIIVYVASDGDTAWKVAKKYQMPVQKISELNELESQDRIKGGTKLLILT